MESNRDVEGNLTPLKSKNIDTGMGLERMAQILQQVPNNYETDLILPIVSMAAQLAGKQYTTCSEADKTALKVNSQLIHRWLTSDSVFDVRVQCPCPHVSCQAKD